MKKTRLLFFNLLALAFGLCFLSCGNLTGSAESEDNNNTIEIDDKEDEEAAALLAEKKAVYAKFSGTTWEVTYKDWYTAPLNIGDKIVFTDTSVTIAETKYTINLDTDLYYGSELNDDEIITASLDEIIYVKNNSLEFILSVDEDYHAGSKYGFGMFYDTPTQEPNGTVYDSWAVTIESVSSLSGSSVDSSLLGTYTFNNATEIQSNGSITLNSDNSWSYSGTKSTAVAKSWSVSGSSLTLNWTSNGYDISETFTVSVSGNTATWTSTNTGVSTWFQYLFGYTQSLSMDFSFTASE